MTPREHEDPRLAEVLDVIFRYAAGDLKARGTLSDDDSALDGVMAGINILGEELEAQMDENRQALQALAESEARFRTVFDAVQDGIIVADAQTRRFRMVNTAICRMLGYSHDELLERGMTDIHPEEELPRIAHVFDQMSQGATGLVPDLPMQRKDGSVFHADTSSGPITIDGVTCLVGVFRDTTERRRAERAEELASRDSLTNLYNHRMFYALLQDEMARTRRFGHPVSLLMLDIDHFKRVNDSYGHQAGDAILKGLSGLLVRHARAVDRVCRYGGEEFTVILPETGADTAFETAERLRTAVAHHLFDAGGGKMVGITVSIGVATCPQQTDALEGLVKAADVALYAAKQGGRNRTCRYEAAMTAQDSTA